MPELYPPGSHASTTNPLTIDDEPGAIMRMARHREILEILKTYDLEESPRGARAGDDNVDLIDALGSYFDHDREITRSVLGIDIYKYSHFEGDRQRIIPVIFKVLYDQTIKHCVEYEPAIFKEADFRNRFISTGDGGFHIFDTPIQALAFAVYLQANIATFNAGLMFPGVSRFLGGLTLRYALTRDTVSRIDDNWFGAAIIANARILSRDALNRCLIDEATLAWFRVRIGTIESLVLVDARAFEEIYDFVRTPQTTKSFLFSPRLQSAGIEKVPENHVREVNLQKVGVVTSKGAEFDIHNLYIQASLVHVAAHGKESRDTPLVVTLGNLNASGISA